MTLSWTSLHKASYIGNAEDVQHILAEQGAGAARARNAREQTPLHLAAGAGHAAIVEILLEAAADAVLARDCANQLALHYAAAAKPPSVDVVQLLLNASPSSAVHADSHGRTPLHMAALHTGSVDVMQLLLSDAPGSAAAITSYGELPLHYGVQSGYVAGVKVLLAAYPEGATATIGDGVSPLAYAVSYSGNIASRKEMLKLLLTAAPEMATVVDAAGSVPLHIAAQCGCADVVQDLLTAAPEASLIRDALGRLPLHRALGRSDANKALGIARILLAVGDVGELLQDLVSAGERAQPLIANLVAQSPLRNDQWRVVPNGCACLASALPVVYGRSEHEAGLLVGRLSIELRQLLRTFAIAVWKAQRQLGVQLPIPIVHRILSYFDA